MSVDQVLQHLINKELPQADRLAQTLSAPTEELQAKRWEMTRELLGAAWSLPLPVTAALARGIDLNNPANAADELKAFRKENVEGATNAAKVLAEKAPNLAAYVPKALDAPPAPKPIGSPFPAPAYDFTPPAYYETSSSGNGWKIGLSVGVVAIILVRCAAFSSRQSSRYEYDNYDLPSYNTDYDTAELRRLLDETRKTNDYDTYTPPPVAKVPEVPERTSDDPEDLYAQMYVSISAYFYDGVATTKQQDAVEKFETATLDRDCKAMRKTLAALQKLPAGDGDYADYALQHTKALRQRTDIVCPVKGAKKAVKKPAAPPADSDAL